MPVSDIATADEEWLIDLCHKAENEAGWSGVKRTATQSSRFQITSQWSTMACKHLKQQHKNLHSIISTISETTGVPLYGVCARPESQQSGFGNAPGYSLPCCEDSCAFRTNNRASSDSGSNRRRGTSGVNEPIQLSEERITEQGIKFMNMLLRRGGS